MATKMTYIRYNNFEEKYLKYIIKARRVIHSRPDFFLSHTLAKDIQVFHMYLQIKSHSHNLIQDWINITPIQSIVCIGAHVYTSSSDQAMTYENCKMTSHFATSTERQL